MITLIKNNSYLITIGLLMDMPPLGNEYFVAATQ